MYWEITPFETREFDSCVMPAENESDHRAAFEYAQARLEDLWDQAKPDVTATVTITQRSGEMPENPNAE